MITDNFWQNTNGEDHITAGKTRWPEGFDVLSELRKMFSGEDFVAEFGCGNGRLAPAFDSDKYHGFDINCNAIQIAKKEKPRYLFSTIETPAGLIFSSALLAYTVLLHISDEDINYCISELCKKSHRIVVAEILGRQWRRTGSVPVFNRDLSEYITIFKNNGFMLHEKTEYLYKHYHDTYITFLDFRFFI